MSMPATQIRKGNVIDFWTELQLDSMDHLAVMTRLSEQSGVDIAERDYPRLTTIGSVRDFLAAGGIGLLEGPRARRTGRRARGPGRPFDRRSARRPMGSETMSRAESCFWKGTAKAN